MAAPRPRRERLDQLLVERGLAANRTKAQALILAGRVHSANLHLDKPGARVPADLPLALREGRAFVSRAGPKLEAALRAFSIDPTGRDALDIGASTGGFTEALLRAGAARVIALDVGRGQLDWSLREDPRVAVLDGVNARYLRAEALPFPPSLATVDVAFISLVRVLPAIVACLAPGPCDLVALVKPQFEVGRGKVGRHGIVTDPALHREVLRRVTEDAQQRGWAVPGIIASPILGAEGNREFLLHLAPGAAPSTDFHEIEARVEAALAQAPKTLARIPLGHLGSGA